MARPLEKQMISKVDMDLPRSRKPLACDKEAARKDFFDSLAKLSPKGEAALNGKAMASELGFSDNMIWRILIGLINFYGRSILWLMHEKNVKRS